MTFTVTAAAQRPARMNGECFYCDQSIGADHKPDCVLIRKKVVVRMTIEYEVDEPAAWTPDEIERRRNNGSWCANNAIAELNSEFEIGDRCMCGIANFKFVKDTSSPYLSED